MLVVAGLVEAGTCPGPAAPATTDPLQEARLQTKTLRHFHFGFLKLRFACPILQITLFAFLLLSAQVLPQSIASCAGPAIKDLDTRNYPLPGPQADGPHSLHGRVAGSEGLARTNVSICLQLSTAANTTEAQTTDWNVFINDVRKKALQFTDDLPDFICQQITRRYKDLLGGNQWQSQDIVESELSYNQRQENYSNIKINGISSTKHFDSLGNAISIGEFGSILRSLFIPETHAKFWKEREGQFRGVQTIVIGFSVPRESSAWTLSVKNTYSLKVGYQGRIWVDARNRSILKISQHTLQLPRNFPILYSETTTEYGYRDIAGLENQSFFLPIAAEVVIRENQSRLSSRNLIEFREFKRFAADVKLKAD